MFSDRNKCHPNPCRNGGICTGTNDVDGFECTCREGYKGKSCEGKAEKEIYLKFVYNFLVHVLPLSKLGNFSFSAVNQCSPNPCKNGALCIEKGTKYECTCPLGYKGVTCEGKVKCRMEYDIPI